MSTFVYLRNNLAQISRGLNDTSRTGSATAWRALDLSPTGSSGSAITASGTTYAGPGFELGPSTQLKYEWISPPIKSITGSFFGMQFGVGTGTNAFHQLGWSVASSDDANIVIGGAPYGAPASGQRGLVYIFSGSTYSFRRILTASNGTAGNFFGGSVACTPDASLLIVGAPNTIWSALSNAGSVYVYNGNNWRDEIQIVASDFGANHFFGTSVACSSDGSTIVVGAYGSGSNRGKVYIYTGSNYETEIMVTASDGVNGDQFGSSVACSADGKIIIVGARLADPGSISNAGKIYVFSGSNFSDQQIITASNKASNDQYGIVACSEDASTIVVGAPSKNSSRGMVYVYTGSNYITQIILTASNSASNDQYGNSINCSNDGKLIAVGAFNKDSGRGRVYLYRGENFSTETQYSASDQRTQNFADPSDRGTQFGTVKISQNNKIVVVGATGWALLSGGPLNGKLYVLDNNENILGGQSIFRLATNESSSTANASVGVILQTLNSTGSVKQNVVDSFYRTEIPTLQSLVTWSLPLYQSSAPIYADMSRSIVNPGDRLRARVYFDDAISTTMQNLNTVYLYFEGKPEETGSSYIEFNRDITFMTDPRDTTYQILYPVSSSSIVYAGELAWTNRGDGV